MAVAQVIDFFNQPIILTLLTLIVGGYLFSLLSDRRARKIKIQEKAIEFIEEVGDDFNWLLSSIYGHIRSGDLKSKKLSALNKRTGTLFIKRFRVRLRSQVYLDSEEFWQKYDLLIWELHRILKFLSNSQSDVDREKLIVQIKEHKAQLSNKWPFKDRTVNEKYEPHIGELLSWTNMIWERAIWLLSSRLQKALK